MRALFDEEFFEDDFEFDDDLIDEYLGFNNELELFDADSDFAISLPSLAVLLGDGQPLDLSKVGLTAAPVPGQFYRIRKGDSLLKVAGRAYSVKPGGKRLAFAKSINTHPFNQRYLVRTKSKFGRQFFPEGIISFLPRFSCQADRLIQAKGPPPLGSCFAVIWIPRKRFNYHPKLGQGTPVSTDNLRRSYAEDAVELQTMVNSALHFVNGESDDGLIDPDNDRRRRVPDTTVTPHRWICDIAVDYGDPDDSNKVISFGAVARSVTPTIGPGSGTLIGSRHVLTAAHVVFSWIYGSLGTPGFAKARFIRVIPALNVTQKPFGVVNSAMRKGEAYFKVPGEYRRSGFFRGPWSIVTPTMRSRAIQQAIQQHNRNDYAVIKLNQDVGQKPFKGKQIGWWGGPGFSRQFRIKAHSLEWARLTNLNSEHGKPDEVTVAGYPENKGGVTQWFGSGPIVSVPVSGPRKGLFFHQADHTLGQSGGPAWRMVGADDPPVFELLGIAVGGEKHIVNDDLVTFNRGVVLTRTVLDQILKWKRSMGGS